MSRFRMKKQPLIVVAGIVWLLAGLNVAILGVRGRAWAFHGRN